MEEAAVGGAGRTAGGKMNRQRVTSTTLASVGYEEQSATLEVEFVDSGHIYQYFGVPSDVHAGLITAESVGAYFNAHVKNAGYQYSRVG